MRYTVVSGVLTECFCFQGIERREINLFNF